MTIPRPPKSYDETSFRRIVSDIEQTLDKTRRKNEDIVLDGSNARFILRSPDGTYFSLSVDNAGTLSTTNLGTTPP